MIVARNADAANYKGFSPLLDKALDLLTPEFLASVGTETVHMDGEKLYATRNIFDTAPDSETFFESHKRYLDIHAVTKGEERMEIADPKALTVDEEKSRPEGDFYAFTEKSAEHQTLILKPGTFLVAFPDDAHRCKGQVNGVSQVEKVVFKILIE
ncbi:MAG: YhcH/YjgK/YiaL family protein [Eubacteriales bacterium]|nr:YhcH/YjgK/YiaL family protein [Eubacteriales bacterium]